MVVFDGNDGNAVGRLVYVYMYFYFHFVIWAWQYMHMNMKPQPFYIIYKYSWYRVEWLL